MAFLVQLGSLILLRGFELRHGLLFTKSHFCMGLTPRRLLIAICLPQSSVAQASVISKTAVRFRCNTSYDTIPSHIFFQMCCMNITIESKLHSDSSKRRLAKFLFYLRPYHSRSFATALKIAASYDLLYTELGTGRSSRQPGSLSILLYSEI